ncbi:MAG: cytochrome c oxidase subunit II [Halobacteriales archaeon]|nr:cytochrome c oxidase subunit II [Halobacteriales archaeon]
MDIHKYEKGWLVASLVLIVFFISTVAYVSAITGVDMVDDSGGTIDPDEVNDDDRFGEPRVEQVGENEYEVYMRAIQFVFLPNTVEVPEDSTVTFYITSSDVVHGYQIVGTNVNTMVIPGQISEITVEFDEPGEHGVICNEYCGSGHQDMEAMVIVHPEDEWEEMQSGGDEGGDS